MKSILLSVLLFFLPCFTRAESQLWEVESNGRRYFVVMLEREGNEDPAFRKAVYKKAENFMIDEYVARGTLDPVRDKQMIEALRTTETIEDGRSHLLVIFEPENGAVPKNADELGRPRAMIRVAHQTEEKMLLPFEERLAARGLRELPQIKVEEGKEIHLPSGLEVKDGKLQPIAYEKATGAVGANVEMKNFVIAKEANENFFPLIMRMIEGAGWTSQSPLTTPATPKSFFGPEGTKKLPKEWMAGMPEPKPLHVGEIYLETGVGKLQRYYERMGFETVAVVQKDPDVSTASTAIMRYPREKLRAFLEYVSKREGDLLQTARFENRTSNIPRAISLPLECAETFSRF